MNPQARRKRKLQTESIEPKCIECRESEVLMDSKEGRFVCTSCGLVLGNTIISDESEWRVYADSHSNKVDMNRIGGPSHPLLDSEEVSSTQIAPSSGSSLTRNQIRVTSGKSERLMAYYKHIKILIDKLKLSSSVKLLTETLFKQMFELDEVKGRNKEVTILACIYIACKLDGVPRTIKELCKSSGVPKRDVGRCYINMQRLVQKGKIRLPNTRAKKLVGQSSFRFVTRFCSILDLPAEIASEAIGVCKKAAQLNIDSGKAPASIAATAILLISRLSGNKNFKTKKEISEATHVTINTLRSLWSIMAPQASLLVTDGYADADAISTVGMYKE